MSAADVNDQVNQQLQKAALQRLLAYQRDGNRALGVYVDKPTPIDVSKQFAYGCSKALPVYLPDFYHYLLAYPQAKPAAVESSFYWARVKFGLKPTLRVVHVLTMRGNPADPMAYATAEKQLYSSHYFETALDLTFCVRDVTDPKQPGFYLIMVMGSEQAGLTGVKGSIVRRTAVGRSVSNLQNALTTIKNAMGLSRLSRWGCLLRISIHPHGRRQSTLTYSRQLVQVTSDRSRRPTGDATVRVGRFTSSWRAVPSPDAGRLRGSCLPHAGFLTMRQAGIRRSICPRRIGCELA